MDLWSKNEHRRPDQYGILAEMAGDRSNWQGIGGYPSTIVCRHLLALADWAAAEPEAWCVARLHFEHPDWPVAALAAVLSLTEAAVRRQMLPAALGDPEDAVCAAGRFVPEEISLTYRRAVQLAHSASRHPTQWRVWQLRFSGLTQCQAAGVLRISQQRVSQLLRRPLLLPDLPEV